MEIKMLSLRKKTFIHDIAKIVTETFKYYDVTIF